MNKTLETLKRAKESILERIIAKHGGTPGSDLKDSKLSIIEAREIIYQELNKLAKLEFDKEFT